MTKKSFTTVDKKGRESTWEWDETPEVRKALEKLHQDIREDKDEQRN
jgi:hypothetical protein|tara:strand:+ start:96 stop:236 length:141 start_codon:yes stop_codon:yes gene_type:complete